MPIGDVDPLELATAVKTQLESVAQLVGVVDFADALDLDNPENLRKGMSGTYAARISFPDGGVLTPTPGMGQTMIYSFGLVVTLLYRHTGNQFARVDDGPAPALSAVLKAAYAALEGKTLGILNQGGLACGPASLIGRGGSLQAMQFTVTARSREARS